MKKVVSYMILTLLLIGTFMLAVNVRLVHAQAETVYINSDGSVSPSSAPISSVDKVTYTFTGNISYPTYNGIVVKRNNIIIDGNGFSVQGNISASTPFLLATGDQTVGLNLTDTKDVTIENTNIQGFYIGITLYDSHNDVINGNNATANGYYGIYLYSSSNNIISGNEATANSYGGFIVLDDYSSNISGGSDATANSWYGSIYLESSSNNTVSGNNVTANSYGGIYLDSSSSNTISGNNVTANNYGIVLGSSSNNIVRGNNGTANSQCGVYLASSTNNTVSGNNFAKNGFDGIFLSSSPGNSLSDNMIEDNRYNFGVSGSVLSDFMNSVDTSNLVNGKPVYYMTSKLNLIISPKDYPDVGYLAAVNCTNMTVQDLALANNSQGILLAFTNDSKIIENYFANNDYDIALYSSSNNFVSGNNATASSSCGIYLESSSNNTVSGNNATANSSYGIDMSSSNYDTVIGNDATSQWIGIAVEFSSSETVSGNNVTANSIGIDVFSSSSDTVSGNDAIANSHYGIDIDYASYNNTVSGNNVTANSIGINLISGAHNNAIYHNNFIGNNIQVKISDSVGNVWDNGYPSGGNYWSDYIGADLKSGSYQNMTGSDGIGDTPYVIAYVIRASNNTDYYPLMGLFSDFNVAGGVDVQVVSNSTVSDFQFNGTAILFNVSGANGRTGFCHVQIPTSLINGIPTVLVDGTQVPYSVLPNSNSSFSYLYFTYGHSTEQVIIMPEFPDPLILAIFMLTTLLTIAIHKKRNKHS